MEKFCAAIYAIGLVVDIEASQNLSISFFSQLTFPLSRASLLTIASSGSCRLALRRVLIDSWCKRRGYGVPDNALAGWRVATVWSGEER